MSRVMRLEYPDKFAPIESLARDTFVRRERSACSASPALRASRRADERGRTVCEYPNGVVTIDDVVQRRSLGDGSTRVKVKRYTSVPLREVDLSMFSGVSVRTASRGERLGVTGRLYGRCDIVVEAGSDIDIFTVLGDVEFAPGDYGRVAIWTGTGRVAIPLRARFAHLTVFAAVGPVYFAGEIASASSIRTVESDLWVHVPHRGGFVPIVAGTPRVVERELSTNSLKRVMSDDPILSLETECGSIHMTKGHRGSAITWV